MTMMNKIVYEINVDVLVVYAFLLQFYLLLLLRDKASGNILKIAGISIVGVCVEGIVAIGGICIHPAIIFPGMVFSLLLQMRLVYGAIPFGGYGRAMRRRIVCFLCMGGCGMIYLSMAMGGGFFRFWAFLQLVYMLLRRLLMQSSEYIYRVRLFVGDEVIAVQALYDTGNRLYEPISGKYVCIVKEALFEKIRAKIEDKPMRYIPYRSMGKAKGVLEGIAIEKMEVLAEGTWREKKDFYIARGTKDAIGEAYDMILHEKAR